MASVNFSTLGGEGRVYNSGKATWADARNAATGDGTDGALIPASDVATTFGIGRAFLPFNTSTLTAAIIAKITSVKLYLYRYDAGTSLIDTDSTSIHVVQSTQANPAVLGTADFDQVGATTGGSIALASTTNNTWFSITLNATAIGWLNAGGNTLLAIRTGRDYDNAQPTGVNRIYVQGTPETYDPYLEVTYASGGSFADYLEV